MRMSGEKNLSAVRGEYVSNFWEYNIYGLVQKKWVQKKTEN
jgi:hypothetical protein